MQSDKPTVHWAGAGLSSVPGIRRLALGNLPLIVWNRSLNKAEAALDGLDTDAEARYFDAELLEHTIAEGDIVVSMLPANWHVPLAEICIRRGAHFISSSYLSDQMRELHATALDQGLCLINEVGLDPGIDHLMAHRLVSNYLNSSAYDVENEISFRSYCGGFPAIPNDFRYKFSWSPLGVIRALTSPAKSILNGKAVVTDRPWHAITSYRARLDNEHDETFQAYPNRDSLPFMQDYHFPSEWRVTEFVRGTLRLEGWSSAWKNIFDEVETLEGDAGQARLQEMSEQLWRDYAYEENEPDRVVLCVELQAQNQGETCWHQSYVIDARGDTGGSAMARLVSTTVSLAVEAVATGKLPAGVHPAPDNVDLIDEWFAVYREMGDDIRHLDLGSDDC